MNDSGDPFAPLGGDHSNATGSPPPDDGWREVSPIHGTTPDFEPVHSSGGRLVEVWSYLSADGLPLFNVARFDLLGGAKDFFPYVLQERDGARRWRAKFPVRRTIYGLHMLALRSDADVLVVEGEKTAVAAQKKFPDLAAVSWPGGSGAVVHQNLDWSPLRGRRVTLWPDADEPGRKAMAKLAAKLLEIGATRVAVVQVPSDFPHGWDLADTPPEGWSTDRLRELLAGAEPNTGPQDDGPPHAEARNGDAHHGRCGDAGGAAHEKNGKPDGDWGEPDMSIADEDFPPPPFPEEMLGMWAGWARATAVGAGCPIDYTAAALFTVVASLIGNARSASPRGEWEEATGQWTMMVGNPSSGKTPAMRPLVGILRALEQEGNSDFPDRWRKHLTALAEAREAQAIHDNEVRAALKAKTPSPLAPLAMIEPIEPQKYRLIANSPTTEKAAAMSMANPRGLLLSRNEIAGWIGNMDRYSGKGGGDRAFWVEAFDGDPHTDDRKGAKLSVDIEHTNWSVLGGVQPGLIHRLLGDDDDGLASRFQYYWPRPGAYRPAAPIGAPDHVSALAALRRIRELPWSGPHPVAVPLTRAAAARFARFATEVAAMEEDAGSGLLVSWIGKLPRQLLRLAMVRTFMDWSMVPAMAEPTRIEVETVEEVGNILLDYSLPMARRVFRRMAARPKEGDVTTLARWLLRQRPIPKTVNHKALHRMAGGPAIPEYDRIRAACTELAEHGWLRPEPGETGGRPRADWAVNPALEGLRAARRRKS